MMNVWRKVFGKPSFSSGNSVVLEKTPQKIRFDNNKDDTTSTEQESHSSSSSSNQIVWPFTTSTTPSTDYMDLVKEMADCKNRQDMRYLDMYQLGTHISFGEMSIDMAVYHDVIHKLFAAFPDLHFHIECMQQSLEEECVVYAVVTVTGTHTGVPYHTPVHPTLIPTSHIRVTLDPEVWKVTFSNTGSRKIVHLHITPLGKYSGPNGMYEKVQKGIARRDKKNKLAATKKKRGVAEQ